MDRVVNVVEKAGIATRAALAFVPWACSKGDMPTPAWWKRFYAEERATLDLDALIERAPAIDFPRGGALVFPHTRLAKSGALVATVARAAARTGQDVLAIGVLHGSPKGAARGVHTEDDHAADEFSLDGFRALYERACSRERVKPGRIVARYPFDVGDHPEHLPGLDELARLSESCAVVGTTDPIHHGIGYDTPKAEAREESGATVDFARTRITQQLDALALGNWSAFATLCSRDRSDFRNAGPALAMLVPSMRWSLDDLMLVDYADVFSCERPTWVAAGRISVRPPS